MRTELLSASRISTGGPTGFSGRGSAARATGKATAIPVTRSNRLIRMGRSRLFLFGLRLFLDRQGGRRRAAVRVRIDLHCVRTGRGVVPRTAFNAEVKPARVIDRLVVLGADLEGLSLFADPA